MKLINKTLLFLPIIILIIIINYFVDPSNIFRNKKDSQEMANILLKGRNITLLSWFDEGSVLKNYIAGLSRKKEIIVLGSSRVMLIDSNIIAGHSFFNSWVTAASIDDIMAVYWMYRKKGFIPDKIIIGLDAWLLNGNYRNDKYSSSTLMNEFQEIFKYIFKKNGDQFMQMQRISSICYGLISPGCLQQSISLLLKRMREGKNSEGYFYSTSRNVSERMIKRADGSLSYDINIRNRKASKALLIASEEANSWINKKNNTFNQLNSNCINKFQGLIDLMLMDNVEIVFFLPPHNPLSYQMYLRSGKCNGMAEAQKYFFSYAKKKKIKIFGSYNPDDIALETSDFYDSLHLKRESAAKIFKRNYF